MSAAIATKRADKVKPGARIRFREGLAGNRSAVSAGADVVESKATAGKAWALTIDDGPKDGEKRRRRLVCWPHALVEVSS